MAGLAFLAPLPGLCAAPTRRGRAVCPDRRPRAPLRPVRGPLRRARAPEPVMEVTAPPARDWREEQEKQRGGGLLGEVVRRAAERGRGGDVMGARVLWEEVVARWDAEVRAWAAYGAFEEALGEGERAGEVWRRAAYSPAGSCGALWERWARWELARGRAAAAREVLRKAVKRCAGCGRLWVMWGKLESGDRARLVFERGVRKVPGDGCLWQAWACFEEAAGNVARAREIFDRGVVADPAFASTWQGWAVLEERAGNVDKARELFGRGVQADQRDPATWQAWGRMETRLGNEDQARRLFREAADKVRGRGCGALFLSWAMLEVKSRNYPVARAVFQQGVRIEREARAHRAQLASADSPVVADVPDRKSDRTSDYGRLLHAWAKMEDITGNVEEARRLFTAALRDNAKDMHVVHALARLDIRTGNYSVARDLLRAGHGVAPGDMYIVLALAQLEWQRFAHEDGVERARELYFEATRAKPDDAALLRGWAELEYVHGDRGLSDRLRRLSGRIRGGRTSRGHFPRRRVSY